MVFHDCRDMKLAVIAGFVISCLNLCQVYGRQVTEPIDGRNQDPTYRYVKPSLIKELLNAGQDIRTNSSKGLEYYLNNYGPLAKVIVTDFMDSFGFARNLQLAIPIVAKMLVIILYAAMQFQPSLEEFKETARSAYVFLLNFNSPELNVMNDITDRVFEALDGEHAASP
ncbi:uncharacterized protein [Macrobrachium rosenbergii]|uniref:uncharacterized protein isoform X1 n=1 Tax=Macrobrachium rosenbergii TaxID=79674 RepID=UPI0034D40297